MSAQFARAPHQGRPPVPVYNAPNAALLIDFDNVTMGIRSDLTKELKNLLNSDIIKGKVAVQRAYADWRRYPQYIVPLSEASVDLIFAPAYGSSKKNATDIRLAIDALELVFTRPEIGCFILLSGDSDFSSLVLKLKEYGKYVIGVGIRESASDLLVQNCDEYYSYSALTGLTRAGEADVGVREDPWTLVGIAVQRMVENRDVMRSDRLKQVMVELDPNFNEKELGFTKFNRFIAEAGNRGLVALRKLENGQFEILPPTEKPQAVAESVVEEEESRPVREREPRSRGGRRRSGRGRDRERERERPPAAAAEPVADVIEIEPVAEIVEAAAPVDDAAAAEAEAPAAPVAGDLDASYELLRRAVAELVDGSEAVRDSDVKRRMLDFDPSWSEANLGYSRFSRFLRQAHDHEIIDLHRLNNGSYEVSLPGGGRGRRSSGAGGESRGRHGRGSAPRVAAAREPERETAAVAQAAPPAEEIVVEPTVEVLAPVESTPAADVSPAPAPAAASATEAAEAVSVATITTVRSVTLGLRRGTKGRGRPTSPPPLYPGQAIRPRGATEAPAEPSPVAVEAAPVIEETSPVAERAPEAGAAEAVVPATDATARAQKSSRSRTRKRKGEAAQVAAAEPTVSEVAAAPASEAGVEVGVADKLGLPTEREAVVAHLTQYKGIGRKTAETVVDSIGADRVFATLIERPEAIREVIQDARRAEALLSAWREDYEQRTASVAADADNAPAVDEQPEPEVAATPTAEADGAPKAGGSGRTRRGRGRRGRKPAGAGVTDAPPAAAESAAAGVVDAAPAGATVDVAPEAASGGTTSSRKSRARRGRGGAKAAASKAAAGEAAGTAAAESGSTESGDAARRGRGRRGRRGQGRKGSAASTNSAD